MKHTRGVLLVLLTCVLSLLLTKWVGGLTIYAKEQEARRLFIHRAVVENRIPDGTTWNSHGANALNIRIGVPYTVEAVHRLTGVGILRIYQLVDLVCIVVLLNLMFLYMRAWFDPLHCLIALLFMAALLPMTYLFHAFQVWDRPSNVLWLLLLILLRDRRFASFTLLLLLSVIVKFDTILLPGLYGLSRVTRARLWRTSLETGGLFLLTFGAYFGLQHLFPGGVEPRSYSAYIAGNTESLLANHVTFPPLLMFCIPFVLAASGWKDGDRFQRSAALFALPMMAIFYVMTNFIEVRAEMPVFFLIAPLAMTGLYRVTQAKPAPTLIPARL